MQIAFQNQMAVDLKKRGVNAVASKRYFTRYTDAEKARFKQSIDDSDADGILLARMTSHHTKTYEDRGTIMGPNGAPIATRTTSTAPMRRYVDPTLVRRRRRRLDEDRHRGDVDLMPSKGEKLIWSARMRTDQRRQHDRRQSSRRSTSRSSSTR